MRKTLQVPADTEKALRKGDLEQKVAALYEVGGENYAVSDSLSCLIIEMISSDNEEICERAIFAAGIHYKWVSALDLILDVLNKHNRHSELTLSTAVSGAGSIGQAHPERLSEVCRRLASIITNMTLPAELRWSAYLELLILNDRITPAEYGKAVFAIDKIKLDYSLIEKMKNLQ